ncbi:MAG: polysaccharide lyase family 7 protein, partial [Pseudonocardia sp.]|nr:polysaccharide lyase family 7 protein [Pseudonocardia sp.]
MSHRMPRVTSRPFVVALRAAVIPLLIAAGVTAAIFAGRRRSPFAHQHRDDRWSGGSFLDAGAPPYAPRSVLAGGQAGRLRAADPSGSGRADGRDRERRDPDGDPKPYSATDPRPVATVAATMHATAPVRGHRPCITADSQTPAVPTTAASARPTPHRWWPRPRVALLAATAVVTVLVAAVPAIDAGSGMRTHPVTGAAFTAAHALGAAATKATTSPTGGPGPGDASNAPTSPGAACPGPAAARKVNDVIDPAQWYLTLPTGQAGHPDTVTPAALARFTAPAFHLTRGAGLVLRATAGGATTAHSDYPRSELREVNTGNLAAWSDTSGTHTLDVCQAVTELPP